jgi:hypothetical protein
MKNFGLKTLGISRHRSAGGGGGPHRPLASEYTGGNLSSGASNSVITDDADALQFQILNYPATINWRLLVLTAGLPSPPYNVKTQFYYYQVGQNSTTCGIYFVDASNAMSGLEQLCQAGGLGNHLRVQHNPSPTSAGPTPLAITSPWGASVVSTAAVWIRLRNDGTTLYYDYSNDGASWTNAYSEAISASGLAAVVSVGLGGICIDNSWGLVLGLDNLHVISLDIGNNATF